MTRTLAAAASIALACLLAPTAAGGRTLRASDKAKLHYVSASGSVLYEIGAASGTLPGTIRVHMRIESIFSGSFTIYAKDGTITGHGLAKPHGSGVYESFAGTLDVTSGTGAYEHASGHAALYGTFDRDSYALTIKTSGTLHY